MIKKEEIEKLADLARITLSSEEVKNLPKEIDIILEYVSLVNNISLDKENEHLGDVYNVMRKDESPHEGGVFTEDLLREAPATEEGYVKVRRILE